MTIAVLLEQTAEAAIRQTQPSLDTSHATGTL